MWGNTAAPHTQRGRQREGPDDQPTNRPITRPEVLKGPLEQVGHSRRVGAHLAVRAPPGTVRAILTAYGSTSETTERHIFQRGQCSVTFVASPQLGLCPLVDETQVAPIIVATGLSSDNVVVYDFGGILQR